MFKKDEYKTKVLALPRVQDFYNSKSKKASKTGDVYLSPLIKLNRFLEAKYHSKLNADTIIDKLKPKNRNREPDVDVYQLLRQYIDYLPNTVKRITASSIDNYVSALRSYFEFNDVDTHRFKHKVTLPPVIIKKEVPIDKSDIAEFVTVCSVPRLKAYLLVLASSGVRDTSEALTARNCDLYDNERPARIHLRGEYTKTKNDRDVYISDEALQYLNQWKNSEERKKDPDRLLFSSYDLEPKESDNETLEQVTFRMAHNLYGRLNTEFHKVLTKVGKDQFKESGVNRIQKRHKITLHSFRRFASTTLENNSVKGYHDFILGHNGYLSTYHTQTEEKIRNDYLAIMPHLTFLNFTALEKDSKDIRGQMREKNQQIDQLNKQALDLKEKITELEDNLDSLHDANSWMDIDGLKEMVAEYNKKNKK